MRRFQAVVFDMDGVLVDSEPLFHQAINELLATEGVRGITPEENRDHLLGTTVEETWRRVIALRRLPHALDYYIERYNLVVDEVLERDLTAQPGVSGVLAALRERGMRAGVASSSLQSWVDRKLRLIGLGEAFDVVIGGDKVAEGKPAPEIYLQAAHALGVEPAACIAIEDTPIGIQAAVAAGMYTIAVRTASTAGMDVSGADVILNSLEDFDLNLLDSARECAVARTG